MTGSSSSSKSLAGMRVLFAGSGAFGVPTLGRMIASGADIVQVCTQPSKPAGRGNKLTPTPIGAFAAAHGLPFLETADINTLTLPAADLLVVIAFGQKLSPHVVSHARLGAINLHASRLPRYRGAAPINWAIIQGDSSAGNSVIRLAQTMDAGAVLAMSELPVADLETAGELHDRLSIDGASLVEAVAIALRDGSASAIEQDHALATKAPKLSREKSAIDFAGNARSIAFQIRGMHPWPGCRVRLLDRTGTELDKVTLVRARAHDGLSTAAPGMFDESFRIATGDGSLEIVELQPDGKRPMTFAAYRNGRRLEAGMRLESVR